MIEAKDLRIGNWIEYEGEYYEVLGIDSLKEFNELKGDVHLKHLVNGIHISYIGRWLKYINPIELTPEILEAAGFSNEGMSVGSEWWNKLVGIRTSYNGVCCYEISLFKTQHEDFGINLEEQYFGYCKYLHELQNKYYAIVGEDPKIELPTTGKE